MSKAGEQDPVQLETVESLTAVAGVHKQSKDKIVKLVEPIKDELKVALTTLKDTTTQAQNNAKLTSALASKSGFFSGSDKTCKKQLMPALMNAATTGVASDPDDEELPLKLAEASAAVFKAAQAVKKSCSSLLKKDDYAAIQALVHGVDSELTKAVKAIRSVWGDEWLPHGHISKHDVPKFAAFALLKNTISPDSTSFKAMAAPVVALDRFEWERITRLHEARGKSCLVSSGTSHVYPKCPAELVCRYADFCTSDDFADSSNAAAVRALGEAVVTLKDASNGDTVSAHVPKSRRQRVPSPGAKGVSGTSWQDIDKSSDVGDEEGGLAVQAILEHAATASSCLDTKRTQEQLKRLFGGGEGGSGHVERLGLRLMTFTADTGTSDAPADAVPHEVALYSGEPGVDPWVIPGQCSQYEGSGAAPAYPRLRGFADHRLGLAWKESHLAFLVETSPGNMVCVWVRDAPKGGWIPDWMRLSTANSLTSSWPDDHAKQIGRPLNAGGAGSGALPGLVDSGRIGDSRLRALHCPA